MPHRGPDAPIGEVLPEELEVERFQPQSSPAPTPSPRPVELRPPDTLPRALRPKEKLLAAGPGILSHAELLTLVLGSGTRREAATRTANRLLRAHGLSGLAGLSASAWQEQDGLGTSLATRLCAAFELGRRAFAGDPRRRRPRLTGPRQAFRHVRQLGWAKKEYLIGLYLDAHVFLSAEDNRMRLPENVVARVHTRDREGAEGRPTGRGIVAALTRWGSEDPPRVRIDRPVAKAQR